MTRHLDPDRSPPPRFWPFPIDIDTSVCDRCSAMVPATDKAQTQHTDHHRQVDALAAGFASAALASQLSGSGSRPSPAAGATAGASPDPAPKSPPTPAQEATAGRAGAEGSNQSTEADAAAGTSLGDVTPPAAVFPPAAAGTQGSRPEGPGSTTGRLHLAIADPPDYRKWTR